MASGRKRQFDETHNGENSSDEEFTFKVMLPNDESLVLTLRDRVPSLEIRSFIGLIRDEYGRVARRSDPFVKQKRPIKWDSCILTDAEGVDFGSVISFKNFKPRKCQILRLLEGDKGSRAQDSNGMFENMWDLTPDAEMLKELPEEYTFHTALADLIDNSLQAVWSNEDNDRRLIRVTVTKDKIVIFDTGPGMDGSNEYSLEKWGRFGASLHRSYKEQAIGGKPPYLKPFFGMFGYGGPMASMRLGRSARVSSKRKSSKKVYILHLEREALLKNSGSKKKWETNGGIRDPRKHEIESAPHGSFTKVEIIEPNFRGLDIDQVECWLKDIYFPYIQCDEISETGKTDTPVEFEFNWKNLSETQGGEVAITNLHSSNGPHFVLQVRLSLKPEGETRFPGSRSSKEANARLTCVYFPVLKGKESIDMILETLKGNKHNISETYEDFSRVSVRRLGRLLPDARWKRLPFMDLRRIKAKRTSHLLKICCSRVKCFIDTDAGITPTSSKTDLAQASPFTAALKNFGNNLLENVEGLDVKVYRDGKLLSPLQLDNEYQDWIIQMHNLYDEEAHCGEDEPVVFVSPQKVKGQKEKGIIISSDVVRFYKILKRKGKTWKSGQHVKLLKGACAGVHKKNVYATIEYFLVEGLEGDSGGYTRIICRPIDVPEDEGFLLKVNSESFEFRKSIGVPISIIDFGKLIPVESIEWNKQLDKELLKFYSGIELLSTYHCQELEVDSEELHSTVEAGKAPPKELVAVVRPANFESAQKDLDQKDVFKCNVEMSLKVEFQGRNDPGEVKHVYAKRVASSQCKGIYGVYVFTLGSKLEVFRKAGIYTFTFSLTDGSCEACVQKVNVNASQVQKWKIQKNNRSLDSARVGSLFGPVSIACYDSYENRTTFPSTPNVHVKLHAREGVLHVKDFKMEKSIDKSTVRVKDILIESSDLDKIKPTYKTTLVISSFDGAFSVDIPLCVYPGCIEDVRAEPSIHADQLFPDCIVKKLKFQVFDAYGNHVVKDSEVKINLEGFQILDHLGIKRMVDDDGCIDLSGVLRVTAGYGENVSLSVEARSKILLQQKFQIGSRELRIASMVPDSLTSGSKLEDLTFEIVSSNGDVDETIHHDESSGLSHMLTIKADWLNIEDTVRYMFKHGRCTVPTILLPDDCGNFSLQAFHSRHSNLRQTVELYLEKPSLQILPPNYGELESPSSSGKLLILQDSPSSLMQVGKKFLMNSESNLKKLDDEMEKLDYKIKELESKKYKLNEYIAEAEQNIRALQGPLELSLAGFSNQFFRKEEVIEEIERRGHTAASVLCCISKSQEKSVIPLVRDIIGVVALLGSVESFQLSRVLSEYLGEDIMLAVVSRSFEAASALEIYQQSGAVDCNALRAETLRLGKTLNNRFLAICLEDIRPFQGFLDYSCPQRKLALVDPSMCNGARAPGFLGFAVNMITLGKDELRVKTSSGQGLRETLFYRLFGNLQVYMTREEMLASRACITHGAVSLDGGILKENGIVSLGFGDPAICFQVVPSRETPSSQANTQKLEHWRSELKKTKEVLGNVLKELKKSTRRLDKVKEGYEKLKESVGRIIATK